MSHKDDALSSLGVLFAFLSRDRCSKPYDKYLALASTILDRQYHPSQGTAVRSLVLQLSAATAIDPKTLAQKLELLSTLTLQYHRQAMVEISGLLYIHHAIIMLSCTTLMEFSRPRGMYWLYWLTARHQAVIQCTTHTVSSLYFIDTLNQLTMCCTE